MWIALELVLFRLVTPPLQPRVVGSSPAMGCMVPQSFATGGNWSYPKFLAITSDPRYFAPTVALEPSVERVAGAGHSMVGRTGSHIVLWALPWDSIVRLQG
jgi:hypothetical protein